MLSKSCQLCPYISSCHHDNHWISAVKTFVPGANSHVVLTTRRASPPQVMLGSEIVTGDASKDQDKTRIIADDVLVCSSIKGFSPCIHLLSSVISMLVLLSGHSLMTSLDVSISGNVDSSLNTQGLAIYQATTLLVLSSVV